MRTRIGNRLRVSLVVVLTVFSLSSTMVPTTALDLGAKAKYIISVTPTAKAAVEAAVVELIKEGEKKKVWDFSIPYTAPENKIEETK